VRRRQRTDVSSAGRFERHDRHTHGSSAAAWSQTTDDFDVGSQLQLYGVFVVLFVFVIVDAVVSAVPVIRRSATVIANVLTAPTSSPATIQNGYSKRGYYQINQSINQ